jgi:outer membrane protein insertion porin family
LLRLGSVAFCARLLVCCAVTATLLVGSGGYAQAAGETITDIRIKGNARTSEETIRSMIPISIGDELERDTLESVREQLNNTGMFSNVNVYWERNEAGVRVVVNIKEKFPWAPVPTFTLSPGDISFGAVLVHGNLFGRGKQGVVGGRISTVSSGAVLGYRDPSMWGTWLYWQTEAAYQQRDLPEYSPFSTFRAQKIRTTDLSALGGSVNLGVFWFRRVRTELGYGFQRYKYNGTEFSETIPGASSLGPAIIDDDGVLNRGFGSARLQFDFRAFEHALMKGSALSLSYQVGSPTFLGDKNINYWKTSVSFENGIIFFKSQNLRLVSGVSVSDRLPIFEEHTAGGTNLRGFLYQQFRGDTQVRIAPEYHVPLTPTKWALSVRGLVFTDIQAIWFRNLPTVYGPRQFQEGRGDGGRSYLGPEYLKPGFSPGRDVHMGVGAGLRFYLRTVSVPLVGFDYGYGVLDNVWRMVLVVGV